MHFLFFLTNFYAKKLVKFEKTEKPTDIEPFYQTEENEFYHLRESDEKLYYFQSVPYIVEAVASLENVVFDKLGEFTPFEKLVVNDKVYNFEYSYISGDGYFQAYSRGFFSKEYFYVTFKGYLDNLTYVRIGNLIELKGTQFLRVIDGSKTIGICDKL